MSIPKNAVDNILRFKKKYLEYRLTEEGRKFEEERRRHEEEIKKILSREELENLDETRLLSLANNLYAFSWWTKKEYLIDYWIKGADGLDKLKENLRDLLYSNRSLAERFDSFRKNVKGVGVAMITEILTYFNPRIYGVWNRRVKEALLKLGITQTKESTDVTKLKINKLKGREYEAAIGVIREVGEILRDPRQLPDPDLLDVDYFLYYVLISDIGPESSEEVPDHDDIIEMVLNIGKGLGFDVSSEVPLTTGARVDVVWSARIGNLGELKYVFEVHVKGSIDSMLLNLMKASQEPSVQKVVAIAIDNELEKIKKEASTIKMLSDKMLFWNVREVVKANELIDELMDIIQRLGLTKT